MSTVFLVSTPPLLAALLATVPLPETASSTKAPDAPLAIAARALAAGGAKEAIDALARVDADLLRDHAALVRAEALLLLGDRAGARKELASIPRAPRDDVRCKPACTHPLHADAQVLLAQSYEAEDPARAARILLELPPDGARLGTAATLFREAKLGAQADAIETRLLLELAETPEARALAERLGPEAVAKKLETPARRTQRIRRLLDAHENESARKEARALIAELGDKSAATCELMFIAGKASRKLRQYGTSIKELSAARERCGKLAKAGDPNGALIEQSRKAGLLETDVRAIRGDYEGAEKLVAWLRARDAGHSYVDDMLFFLGDTLQKKGLIERAGETYQRILDQHPNGDQAAEAAWRLAFLAIPRARGSTTATTASDLPAKAKSDRAKEKDAIAAKVRATKYLRQVLAGPAAKTVDGARARYWLARLAEPAGSNEPADGKAGERKPRPKARRPKHENTAAACRRWEPVILEPPLTFYAFMALDRLERTDPGCREQLVAKLLADRDRAATRTDAGSAGARDGVDTGAASILTSRTRARALALGAMGFTDFARRELALLDHDGLTRAEVVALALSFDEVGGHREAQALLRWRAEDELSVFPSGPAHEVWRAAYSRPYSAEVEAAARESKIDPLLLLALAREESTFDPRIVSWAGAVGLAQLMPETALMVGADLGLGRIDLARLTEPALNLRLGARVLKDGLRRFGAAPLALAAYNGGPGLVLRNLPPRPVDLDLWMERIDVKETRRYVRRVLGTYGIYRFLYDREGPFPPLPDAIGPSGAVR